MTAPDKDKLEAILAKATPAPWGSSSDGVVSSDATASLEASLVQLPGRRDTSRELEEFVEEAYESEVRRVADVLLVASAPDVARELQRLRRGLEELVTSGNDVPVSMVRAEAIRALLDPKE